MCWRMTAVASAGTLLHSQSFIVLALSMVYVFHKEGELKGEEGGGGGGGGGGEGEGEREREGEGAPITG